MTDRTIDDVSSNDMSFKHLETTKDIIITPKNQFGNSVYLDADHTWTAKVSDGANYVGDYPVTIDSTNIVVNSSDFTKLPAGNYHLEIWEEWIGKDDKQQRSIYPSPQQTIDFTIYQSIPDLAEKEIKKIGFQDVVDQAVMNIGMNYVFKVNTVEPDQTATVVQAAADGKNYVTFNIPRGAKGDKGDQGVQGIQGQNGNDGHTPVRGVDYWTNDDKQSIYNETKKYVEDALELFEIKTNEVYQGSLNNIDHSSILFVMGEKGQAASVQSQNVPVDGKWWLVLTITSINAGGRKWQFAASDSDSMLFLRVNPSRDNWLPWIKLGGNAV